MARNIETREGYEFWDRLCRLQRYSFFLGDGPSVRKVEDGTGNWIEVYGAQSVMDDAQSEINELREQNAKLEAEVQALREEVGRLHSTMIAAAEEIHEHWDAHCDEEGYGPSNLMYRLEKCVDADYPGYTAGAFARLEQEVAALEEENGLLRAELAECEALRARVVVLPSVDSVMNIVMRYQWNEKTNVTGTTNWAANLGMKVVDEVKRLNGKAVSEGMLREACAVIRRQLDGCTNPSEDRDAMQVCDSIEALIGEGEEHE